MRTAYDVILKPIITEHSMMGVPKKVYTFEVALGSEKLEIKRAVEEIFKVKVAKVNTINVKGKKKRLGARPQGSTAAWKKAIVTLAPESETIAFFDGMF